MWHMAAYSTSKDWASFPEAPELLQDCKKLTENDVNKERFRLCWTLYLSLMIKKECH